MMWLIIHSGCKSVDSDVICHWLLRKMLSPHHDFVLRFLEPQTAWPFPFWIVSKSLDDWSNVGLLANNTQMSYIQRYCFVVCLFVCLFDCLLWHSWYVGFITCMVCCKLISRRTQSSSFYDDGLFFVKPF